MKNEEYVDQLYRLLLRRAPEPAGREAAASRLASGTVSRATLASELASSPEFERVRALDDGVARALQARKKDERPRELTAPAGQDERPIEIAWTLARYRGEKRVLDVGYANAERAYLAALLAAAPAAPTGADLAEANVPGIESVRADVRDLPFRRGSFDVVFWKFPPRSSTWARTTVSTGRAPSGTRPGSPQALGELRRVLGRNGRLLSHRPDRRAEDRSGSSSAIRRAG